MSPIDIVWLSGIVGSFVVFAAVLAYVSATDIKRR